MEGAIFSYLKDLHDESMILRLYRAPYVIEDNRYEEGHLGMNVSITHNTRDITFFFFFHFQAHLYSCMCTQRFGKMAQDEGLLYVLGVFENLLSII